ncbi:chorismate synthase [Leptospira interrogans]|uniref:Chorismate synthase n=25 Tax=Leptospira TaxID=171 RepID=AROC_LEPIN|nr:MULTISPECIES: chorismate synthase [Leptospira]Q72W01.1 RecName: Full=Chorismate synthase; Short=CS; AltName: Full=5-enolpyruvylshikimate-3-phosphate phospholyase [Leptospira interrogans serovar Copenhageni str. Fiocruz L1-130]Q8F9N4.1 RecName: Full=Chorismate synthase; Short=CS; AltName: Full=5-enolpyruvylshikimate-3-phosphate phospholyase [Leptospira interrogans serovar Lai str. 56601]EMF43512.1 chorismate synthase [Leptospira interrogans serovar Lora str. TE 1992]EMF72534.1 chorismate synt
MPSSWGKIFKVSTFGESHGTSVGVVVEGVPAGIPIRLEEIQKDLNRRRPGQSNLTTPRDETDTVRVVSGVFEGKTIGSPIALIVDNQNTISKDYENLRTTFRPSHADYTYQMKYGFRAHVGGGRSSVRETIGRVAAAAIARMILKDDLGIETIAWVDSIGTVQSNIGDKYPKSREEVDQNEVRCPDVGSADQMRSLILKMKEAGDSVGGTIQCVSYNLPPGLGDPVYDKLDGDLAKAILSIPACKGFEVGSGFSGTLLTGSSHNDEFYVEEGTGRVRTRTNHSGGLQGGISNGEELVIRAAFKPTSTIFKKQNTINLKGEETILEAKGRHDPCVLPRAVPIIEAVVNLVLIDAYLYQRAINPQWFQKWARIPDYYKDLEL